ncbi:hypothetical protein SteCoe_26717 [Stentor coeruleus]|uniref:Uncharacterized protein n=1 Tax=Stentor coeruleus TaxID=5963 RepID=A0A1R2BC58_9CILI|nr:hypothetical protein SteCoe_26717 [Stentor coeruleus]
MATFPYNDSWYINDLFFGWIFQALKYYRKSPPNSKNPFEVPDIAALGPAEKILKSHWEKELKKPKPSFFKAIFRTISKELWTCILIVLLGNLLTLFQSVLINFLITYLQKSPKPQYEGGLLATAFIFTSIFSCCFKHNGSLKSLMLTGKIKNLVAIMVGEKVVKLNNTIISEQSVKGKIINVVSNDMEVLELTVYAIYFLCSPFVVVISIIIIVSTFGPAGLLGIGISMLHAPLVIKLGNVTMKIRLQASRIGDKRIKMIQNLIEGIKIMKLYAWEIPLLKSIFAERKKEIKTMEKTTVINSGMHVLAISGVPLVIFCTLSLKVLIGEELKAGEVYMLISIFYITHLNIVYISTVGANTVFAFFAITTRVTQVLTLKEHEFSIDHDNEDYSVVIDEATLSWKDIDKTNDEDNNNTVSTLLRRKTTTRECLRNISVSLQPGELLMVVGPVGAGKSSLFMGILGELPIVSGSISTRGSIAYASEDPWILAGSVKDNILMGKEFNSVAYDIALQSSDMMKDLATFKNADETLLGDRGFTLSGGQRARLCLARTVYSNADIVLLDDPLSAVDAEVANHLFNDCILSALKGKTIILATHQVHYLPQADKILVLNSGEMMFFGTYNELKEDAQAREILGDLAFREEAIEVKERQITAKVLEVNEKQNIEEEEITEGAVSMKSYVKYTRYGYKSMFFFALVVVFSIASQTCYVLNMFFASYWSNQKDQENPYYFEFYGILLAFCYALCALKTYPFMIRYINSNNQLHNLALQSLALTESVFFYINYNLIYKTKKPRIINRFSKDVGVADGPLQHYLNDTMSTTLAVVGSLITIIIIIPINLAMLPFQIATWFLLLKYVAPIILILRKLELVARAPLLSTINSALNGLPTLRCLNLQEMFIQKSNQQATEHLRSYITFHVFIRFIQLYSDLGSNFILILNVIIIVAVDGYISPTLAAFSLASSVSLLGVSSIWSKNVVELSSNMASAQRLLEFSDLKYEGILEGNDKFIVSKGKIEFCEVSMRYRPNFDLALNKLSFTIDSGLKVGIIGRTGCGKSSILQVLFRLVNPESGTVYIDGQDYMKAGLHDLRGQMSVIPQSSMLFVGSVKDNLDPFHKHSDDELFKVLEEVKLKEYILEYDKGLDAEISGDGVSFSAGQRQLLCLARAILRNNKIVMMDEATANVDNETDRLIQETVKIKFNECTLLIIAHRLRTVIDSDRIIVVDKGSCKEFGKAHELYRKKKSLFKTMILNTGPEESEYLRSQLENNRC